MAELPRYAAPRVVDRVIPITANRTLKQSESGAVVIFDSTTSLIATLPAPKPGLRFLFQVRQLAGSGVGHLVKVAGTTEKFYSKTAAAGTAIAEAAGKGVVNTQGTGVKGDFIEAISDGTHWVGINISGIFAREA